MWSEAFMARNKRFQKKTIYKYQCNLTNEKFKVTKRAPEPDELVSIEGFYQLHPEDDDRPEDVKARARALAEEMSIQQSQMLDEEEEEFAND